MARWWGVHPGLPCLDTPYQSVKEGLRWGLLLGPDAWQMAHDKLESLNRDLQAWKDVTLGTDFDD